MRAGETMCYYRARGGAKSVYITIVYENNILRESIVERREQKVQEVNQKQYTSLEQSNVFI